MTDLADATVAIVGVGLLGGSLALALEGRCARRVGVVAPGTHPGEAQRVVDEVVTFEAAAASADVVVLATPVRTIVELVPRVAQLARDGALVTDVGSTKRVVVEAMARAARERTGVSFAGSHPMCGGIESGAAHASADLFEGATWFTCPVPGPGDGVARAAELARAVGARPRMAFAEEHDAAVALVSHLPHVLAAQLEQRLDEHDAARAFAAAGWARITAGAGGDPTMWGDILATNGDCVAAELDALAARLASEAARLRG